jgi:hypothetical protein
MKYNIKAMKKMLKISKSILSILIVILTTMCINTEINAQDCNKAMACNSNVQVSLDKNCTEVVTPKMMLKYLEFPVSDYSVTVKFLNGSIVPGGVLNSTHIGQKLEVSVKLDRCGLSCWGFIWVEDKLPPTIIGCDSVRLNCDANTTAGIGVPRPTATDACGSVTVTQLKDVITSYNCTGIYTKIIERPWMFTDQSGNVATCVQVICLLRKSISSIKAPPNYDGLTNPSFECGSISNVLASGAPSPVVTGYPLGIGCDNFQVTFKDLQFAICGNGKKVLREWTVIDWCTGKDTMFNQTIKILDTKAPLCSVNPATVVNLNTDPKKCTAAYRVPAPQATDCSNWTYTVGYSLKKANGIYGDTIYTTNIVAHTDNTFTLTSLPTDTTRIIYKLTDACGNISYCSYRVAVKDNEAPSANCLGFTVISLKDNGWASLNAISVNSGSEDNCGIKSIQIRRIDSTCVGFPQDKTFQDAVNFCCSDLSADPNSYIKVVIRVTDHSGNFNECISNVKVQDKQAPKITCPANITLQCFQDYKNLSLTGGSATATDNCTVRVLPYVDVASLSKCGLGIVRRKWTAVDNQGLRDSCIQLITIVNDNPFNETYIVFPRDTTVNVCATADQITPEYLNSKPIFTNTGCTELAVSYTDEFFTAENACQKIIRTWRVINWCDYNANSKEYYTHTQKILVKDAEGPRFISGCVNRTIVSKEGDCEEEVHHRVEATDNCTAASRLKYTWEVDLNSDQTIDRVGTGPAVSQVYPSGNHKMIFRVVDDCGNVTKCEYTFNITDNKKPTPVCIGELVWVLDKLGRAEIWAKDFNLKSEAFCNGGKLKFSFDSLGRDTFKVLTCANVPNGIASRIPLRMYVIDENGNFEFCSVILNLQDSPNSNACPDQLQGGGMISGRVINNAMAAEKNIEVKLTNVSDNIKLSSKSNDDGKFEFGSSQFFKTYMLAPSKTDDHLRGVNTIDLLILQRHILSIKTLETPYQYIAGDINSDERINISDLVTLKQVILGVVDNFPSNRAWRFIPRDLKFNDPKNPYRFEEVKTYNSLMLDDLAADFLMLKMGDLDASYANQSLFGRKISSVEVIEENTNGATSYYAGEDFEVSAMQMSLNIYGEISNVTSGKLNIKDDSYAIKNNDMKVSWVGAQQVSIKKGDLLFTIAHDSDLSLSSSLVPEIYDNELNTKGIKIVKKGAVSSLEFKNFPNPFSEQTTLQYYLPKKSNVKLTIFDQQGRVVFTSQKSLDKGFYKELIGKEQFTSGAGLYLAKISSDEESKTLKLLLID